MPLAVHNAAHYQIKPTDVLFFDANIWIYIYAPLQSPPKRADCYSELYTNAISEKIKIATSWIILSEFTNRIMRLEYEKFLKIQAHNGRKYLFKDYRQKEGSQVAFHTSALARKIIQRTFMIGHTCERSFCEDVLNAFGGNVDFNDAVIAHDVALQGMKIVTDDIDFNQIPDIEIITANPKYGL